MRYASSYKLALISASLVMVLVCASLVEAQCGSNTKAQPASNQGTPSLTATLVDPEKKAQQKAATVSVKVDGIKLVDPATAMEKAKPGEGHLHYQVDSGPIIATTTTKLSFHGLTPGAHKIVVMLAGNDHAPLGPQQTLEVTIP